LDKLGGAKHVNGLNMPLHQLSLKPLGIKILFSFLDHFQEHATIKGENPNRLKFLTHLSQKLAEKR